MSLTKNTETLHTSIDSSIYINQLKENPLSDNQDAVHRFPEVRAALAPRRILTSPLLFSMDARYNNFARDSYTFDDRKSDGAGGFIPETDTTKIGVYDPSTDLIRTGQRIDVSPRVSMPVALGPYVDLLPSAAYRETRYLFPIREYAGAQRRLVRGDISARTRFSRIFGDLDNPTATRYRHEIVPEVTHTSIPWVQRQSHPFFGPTDEEAFYTSNTALNDSDTNKQFDYHDRLYERNLFTFAISNYLIRKKWEANAAQYSQIALFRLSQSYDYYESIKKSNPRQPWSDISALLDVRLENFETNSLVRYYPYQNVATTSSRLKLIHPLKHFVEFNYSQDFQITKGSRVNAAARSEDLITSLGFYQKIASLTGHTTYSFVTHKLYNYGYSLTLNPPGNCWYITFGQERQQNELIWSFNASFLFDGKQATSLGSTTATAL